MPDESFTITYGGPALAQNRMDVRQLAPALIALADAVQAAHAVAAPLQTPPGLQIAATQPGSFSVDLLLREASDLAGGLVDLLNSPEVGALNTAMGIAGVGIVGLMGGAISLAKRRHASAVAGEPDPSAVRPGWVRMTFSDQTTLGVPSRAVDLADDLAFRQAMNGVVEPLRQPGIEDLALTRDQRPVERITRADLPAFAAPLAEEELLSDSTREVVLRLLNVSFVPGNKWRVSDGARDLWVSLQDLAFAQRVESNEESFRAGGQPVVPAEEPAVAQAEWGIARGGLGGQGPKPRGGSPPPSAAVPAPGYGPPGQLGGGRRPGRRRPAPWLRGRLDRGHGGADEGVPEKHDQHPAPPGPLHCCAHAGTVRVGCPSHTRDLVLSTWDRGLRVGGSPRLLAPPGPQFRIAGRIGLPGVAQRSADVGVTQPPPDGRQADAAVDEACACPWRRSWKEAPPRPAAAAYAWNRSCTLAYVSALIVAPRSARNSGPCR